MSRTPLHYLILLLSAFSSFAAVAATVDDAGLAPRQSPNANAAAAAANPDAINTPICMNYAMVANISVVALNSTLRGAFLRSAPMGTDAAVGILNAQSPKFMGLMMDQALNANCGNLSAVAFAGAEANLTANTVLGLDIATAPGVAVDNLALPILGFVFIGMFGSAFMTL
ncbi:hypothetical protein F4778DRAFT_719030 [Xylariomycetidae sp. FL2044]|nr:hypothetical protein F4778DRAFT_719030 [Xylariomycetidae sp. FL2044]